MKGMFGKWMAALALVAGTMFLTGCGEKECFFISRDGNGLKPGAQVMWNNEVVGKVSTVKPVEGGTQVGIAIDKKHANSIHDGVAARVVSDGSVSPQPFVLLIGGQDATRPVLVAGSQIPESRPGNVVPDAVKGVTSFFKWLRDSRPGMLTGIIVILVLLVVMLFYPAALRWVPWAVFLILVALLIFAIVDIRADWNRYNSSNNNPAALSTGGTR